MSASEQFLDWWSVTVSVGRSLYVSPVNVLKPPCLAALYAMWHATIKYFKTYIFSKE